MVASQFPLAIPALLLLLLVIFAVLWICHR